MTQTDLVASTVAVAISGLPLSSNAQGQVHSFTGVADTRTMAPLPEERERPFRVLLTGFGPFRNVKTNPSWLAVEPLDGTSLDEPPASLPSRPLEAESVLPISSIQPAHNHESDTASLIDHIQGTEVPVSIKGKKRRIELSSELIATSWDAVLDRIPVLHGLRTAAQAEGGQSAPQILYDMIMHVGVGLPGGIKLEQRARRWGYEDKGDVDEKLAPREISRRGGGAPRFGLVGQEWDEILPEGLLRTKVNGDAVSRWVSTKRVERIRLSDDAGLYLCEFIELVSMACSRAASVKLGRQEIPVQFVHVPPLNEPYTSEELTQALKLIVWGIINEGGLT